MENKKQFAFHPAAGVFEALDVIPRYTCTTYGLLAPTHFSDCLFVSENQEEVEKFAEDYYEKKLNYYKNKLNELKT